jgi:hypothetical protein
MSLYTCIIYKFITQMVITELSSLSWQFIASLNHVSRLGHSVGVGYITDIVDVLLLLSSR